VKSYFPPAIRQNYTAALTKERPPIAIGSKYKSAETGQYLVVASVENDGISFDDPGELLDYLRGDVGADYLHFTGEGEFGEAWIAWEGETLYFTSESGLRIQNHSAFLFAQQCLDAEEYNVRPVSRSAVAYLDELVS
jgi:hypothetical protein